MIYEIINSAERTLSSSPGEKRERFTSSEISPRYSIESTGIGIEVKNKWLKLPQSALNE
jgi:hypothetical protein